MKENKNLKSIAFIAILVLTNILVITWAKSDYELVNTIINPESDDTSFGYSIATNNQNIIVGAKDMTVGETTQAGQVYILNYERGITKTLTSDNPQQDYKYGTLVTTGYENILVSEMLYSYRFKGVGTVYLYDENGELLQKIASPVPEDRYFFGLSTVILSDRLIISEPKADTEIEKWAGKVHLYDKSGNLIQTKVSPDPKTTGNFGFRVVADEDIIVVSELVGNIEMQEFKTGSVYVFDNEFGLQATLSPPNPDELNYFGYSLGLSDDFIFVGDRQATAGGQERAGVIYVYDRVGELQFTIESRNPSTGSYFGESMAVEEDILVVGEPYFDHETVDTGKIYVYKKTNGDYTLEDEIVPSEPTAKGWFGKTVSLSDGKIIVGETGTENVFVYSLGEPPKAELIFANLEVPDEVLKGETATITVDCTNIGTVTGSTSVCLNIDGVMIENKTVTVDAGKTEPVNFTYSPDEVGTHKVEIEGLVSEYEVKDVPPVPPVPGYPVNAVVSGLLVTAYLVYYLSRNQ